LPPGKFKVKAWKSPATGLRLKVLQFPLGFSLPDVNNTFIETTGSLAYLARSIYNGPMTYIAMGLLPMQYDGRCNIRPATTITRPTHDIWKINEGKEMKIWFSKAFPRFQFDSDAGKELISDQEWERFAKAEGTRFPNCQYANGVSYSSLDGHSSVVLLGDALHSYPPDIGQGVNSGLADVVAFDKFLQNAKLGSKDPTSKISMGEAMADFEKERLPEVSLYKLAAHNSVFSFSRQRGIIFFNYFHSLQLQTKALIRLARFGSPYQYKQPHLRDKIGQKLWLINILTRAILSKITFGLVAQPVILTAFINPDIPFRRIMIHADITTVALWGTVFWIGKSLLWKLLGRN
jgi:kynurenine 3-monooxygenase